MLNSNIKRDKDLSFSSNKLRILPTIKLKNEPFDIEKPIVFLHQSKTAGTNIDYLIKAIASLQKGDFIEERAAVPRKEGISPNLFVQGSLGGLNTIVNEPDRFDCSKRNIKFISGHMPLPTAQHEADYFKTQVSYITLVRDPIDRELSLANFVFQRDYIKQEEMESFILERTIDNLQTRFLAGEEYMVGECDEATFTKAIGNILDRLTLVAPTEDVESLMSIVSSHLGAENIAYAKGQITGMKILTRENVDLCEKIASKHQFDVRLHEFVKKYWEIWKAKNIESISDNRDAAAEYLVLSPLFYQTKTPEIMGLSQIENYGTDQPELMMLNQNMKSNANVDFTLIALEASSDNPDHHLITDSQEVQKLSPETLLQIGAVFGNLIVSPMMYYLKDQITGQNDDKNLVDYLSNQWSVASLTKASVFSITLYAMPNGYSIANKVLIAKFMSDSTSGKVDLSYDHVISMVSYMAESFISFGIVKLSQQNNLYQDHSFAVGALATSVGSIARLGLEMVNIGYDLLMGEQTSESQME